MATIQSNLDALRRRIEAACGAAGRPVQSVTLLAVSKTFGADAVREASAAGLARFGENYVQEGVAKIAALADLRPPLEWHCIGPLQANKTRLVAEHFDWVHSVDRLKVAERLSSQRPPGRPPLQVCLQVDVSGEASKAGVPLDEAGELAAAIAALPNLRLRGLMSIPAPAAGLQAQREPHRRLRELFDALNRAAAERGGGRLDTLSMGMSADLEAAIAEGATLIRVGTAIFGGRNAGLPQ